MVEKDKEEDKEKKKERFELVEVPTQTTIVVKDNQSEELWDDKQVFAEILNRLDRIEKNTG